MPTGTGFSEKFAGAFIAPFLSVSKTNVWTWGDTRYNKRRTNSSSATTTVFVFAIAWMVGWLVLSISQYGNWCDSRETLLQWISSICMEIVFTPFGCVNLECASVQRAIQLPEGVYECFSRTGTDNLQLSVHTIFWYDTITRYCSVVQIFSTP